MSSSATTNPPPEQLVRYFRRVAHDAANPCNAVATHLELIAMLVEDRAEVQDAVERARVDIARTMSVLRSRLYLPPGELADNDGPVRLHPLIAHVWSHLDLGARGCELENHVPESTRWVATAPHLFQALSCLLANAAESGADVVTCALSEGNDDLLRISNRHDGATADATRWREPYFTTKAERGHLGIGLGLAEYALEQCDASLKLRVRNGVCEADVKVG